MILHGFGDDECNGIRPLREDALFEIVEEERSEFLFSFRLRASQALGVSHVERSRDERLERLAVLRNPHQREGTKRRPVVGRLAGNGLEPELPVEPEVLPRDLPGGLHAFPARGGQEDMIETFRREALDFRGELHCTRMRAPRDGVIPELLVLFERGEAELLTIGIAEVDAEKVRQRIQVSVAIRIDQVASLPSLDDAQRVRFSVRLHDEVAPEVGVRVVLVGGGVGGGAWGSQRGRS